MKNKQKEFINLILEKVVKMKIFEGQEYKMKKLIWNPDKFVFIPASLSIAKSSTSTSTPPSRWTSRRSKRPSTGAWRRTGRSWYRPPSSASWRWGSRWTTPSLWLRLSTSSRPGSIPGCPSSRSGRQGGSIVGCCVLTFDRSRKTFENLKKFDFWKVKKVFPSMLFQKH